MHRPRAPQSRTAQTTIVYWKHNINAVVHLMHRGCAHMSIECGKGLLGQKDGMVPLLHLAEDAMVAYTTATLRCGRLRMAQ